jgi:hypothetical protein
MRRNRSLLFITCLGLAVVSALPSLAQLGGRGGGGGGGQQADDDAKKKKRDAEFGNTNLGLPLLKNAGPCPFVKVLYDAARYVEFKDGAEASAAVGYTGEIQNIASACEYVGSAPIHVKMQILFELGRGPQAAGRHKDYSYWVAVTDRNHAVLAKQYFTLPVTFPGNEDRVVMSEMVDNVIIPRANKQVSGSNFEVLAGFEVTPQMADFNRQGKRFRPNAGQTAVTAEASAQAPPAKP